MRRCGKPGQGCGTQVPGRTGLSCGRSLQVTLEPEGPGQHRAKPVTLSARRAGVGQSFPAPTRPVQGCLGKGEGMPGVEPLRPQGPCESGGRGPACLLGRGLTITSGVLWPTSRRSLHHPSLGCPGRGDSGRSLGVMGQLTLPGRPPWAQRDTGHLLTAADASLLSQSQGPAGMAP